MTIGSRSKDDTSHEMGQVTHGHLGVERNIDQPAHREPCEVPVFVPQAEDET